MQKSQAKSSNMKKSFQKPYLLIIEQRATEEKEKVNQQEKWDK